MEVFKSYYEQNKQQFLRLSLQLLTERSYVWDTWFVLNVKYNVITGIHV